MDNTPKQNYWAGEALSINLLATQNEPIEKCAERSLSKEEEGDNEKKKKKEEKEKAEEVCQVKNHSQ